MTYRYVPMHNEFFCELCKTWRKSADSKYVPKKGDPLHALRVCAQCAEKAK